MLHLRTLTPLGATIECDTEFVVIPGACGELGILPGHIPLLTAVRPGVLTYRSGGKYHRLAITRGVVQVAAGNDVWVLVHRSQTAAEIDLPACVAAHDLLRTQIEAWEGSTCTLEGLADPAYETLRDDLAWVRAQIEVAQAAPGITHTAGTVTRRSDERTA